MNDRYQKLLISLRHYLLGAKYFRAMEALDYATKIHTGTRKDGKTPEFIHQTEIALYLSGLNGIEDEEDVICAALLHDTTEDYPVSSYEIAKRFGNKVANAVVLLDKNTYKKKTDNWMQNYFDQMAHNSIASLVKGADRINNLNSMKGVFSKAKQKHYAEEVDKYFIPMLKIARKEHPRQLQAYYNILLVLRTQVNMLRED
jgi:(p)ppGpp synthase/HD superfamily hydrolase